MKIVVFGGSGQTGLLFIKDAVIHGHEVTAYVRNKEKLEKMNFKIDIVQDEMDDFDKIVNTITDKDAIVSCLGGEANKESTKITDMTKVIVDAMEKTGLRRILNISSAGIHKEFSFFTNLIVSMFYKHAIDDHRGAAEYIMSHDLDYTVTRPLSLTNGERTKHYRCETNGIPKGSKNISRQDLAHFLLSTLEKESYIKESVCVAY